MELHGEQLAEDPGAEEGVQQRVVGHHGEAGQAAHQVTWGDTSSNHLAARVSTRRHLTHSQAHQQGRAVVVEAPGPGQHHHRQPVAQSAWDGHHDL